MQEQMLLNVKETANYLNIGLTKTREVMKENSNALAAADRVLIPVQAHYLPVKGMTQLVNTIDKVRKNINNRLKIDGIVITLVDARTNLSKDIIEILRNQYGRLIKIYDSKIPIELHYGGIKKLYNKVKTLYTILV